MQVMGRGTKMWRAIQVRLRCYARLKSSLQQIYGRHHNLVYPYEISISEMTNDLFLLRRCFLSSITAPRLLPNLTVYMSNTALFYKKQ